MELREALTQIAEIRQQMARGQVFRGYRSATTACSGIIAVFAGLIQWACVPDPAAEPKRFVLVWLGAAVVSLIVVAAEMIIRTQRSQSTVQRQLSMLAVEQFTPSLIAGGLLSWVFYEHVRESLWMLPGLWMLVFALGVFASARLLPRPVFIIGGYYLLVGILTLVLTAGGLREGGPAWSLSPWLMAVTFGIGQTVTAAILYWKLERSHE